MYLKKTHTPTHFQITDMEYNNNNQMTYADGDYM